jgi:hypothetical protein
MVLKRVLSSTGIVCASLVLVLWSGLSMADPYRPDQFLGMDLNKAALSPNPLGPPTTFAPAPVGAKTGRDRAQARLEPGTTATIVVPKTRIAEHRAERPRGSARAKLARRHGNPLDAEAFDTRIQVWPCKSGGICNWKR